MATDPPSDPVLEWVSWIASITVIVLLALVVLLILALGGYIDIMLHHAVLSSSTTAHHPHTLGIACRTIGQQTQPVAEAHALCP